MSASRYIFNSTIFGNQSHASRHNGGREHCSVDYCHERLPSGPSTTSAPPFLINVTPPNSAMTSPIRLAFASSIPLRPTPVQFSRCTPRASASDADASHPTKRPRYMTRRAALGATGALLASAASLALPRPTPAIELYKTGTTRYIPQGRPKPTGPKPEFTDAEIFTVDSDTLGDSPTRLEVQDLQAGSGDAEAARGSLAVARWKIFLDDGSLIEESEAAEMFRVGVAQVYPGIDAVLLGMKPGGVRQCRGVAPAFFSDITSGERSLVPSNGTVYATVELRQLDPFKTGSTQMRLAN